RTRSEARARTEASLRSARAYLGRAGAPHEPRVRELEQIITRRRGGGTIRERGAGARPILALRARYPCAANPESEGRAIGEGRPNHRRSRVMRHNASIES